MKQCIGLNLGLTLLLALGATGCGEEESAGPEISLPSDIAQEPAQPPAPDTVDLERGGFRFDPAIDVSRVPVGAWYCDMGTVHYASPAQGDGNCPVCGMRLVERAAATGHDEDVPRHEHGETHE